MKKVLILTASTGEGHNAAAKSLETKYQENGYETYKIDMFKETSKTMNYLIADGYRILASSFPSVYGILYDAFDHSAFNNKILKNALVILKKSLLKEIKAIEPDVIIGTHPFAVGLVSSYKRKGLLECSFISVVTDFKAHYAYVDEQVDAYITGSEYTKKSLIERKISEDKIFTYGIPIKQEFMTDYSDNKVSIDKFRVLVMGGSMGSKDIAKVVKRLAVESNRYLITVVCGNNLSLKNNLEKKYEDEIIMGRLNVLGFTNQVPYLMDNSDVIVTKPGGLTTTEALSKRIPMIIPFAIPGQEMENTEFLVHEGVAIHVEDMDDINIYLDKLVNDKNEFLKMKKNMERIASHYSVDSIIDLSESLVEKGVVI